MTTIPALDPVTDILDTDLVMVTNAQGNSYTIAGSELNKRNKIIMASNTTVTGAPLKAGGSVRIYFSADITANDGNTVMQINYNGVNYYVKAPKDGSLINFVAHAVGNVYKYVQAYTTLEMLFDGNQFVIIGNPVVISNSDYVINADGSITQHNRHLYKYSTNGTITFEFVKPTEDYLINKYFLINAVDALSGYSYPYYGLVLVGKGDNEELYCEKSNIVNNCIQNVTVNYNSATNKITVTVVTGATRTSVASLCDIAIY